MSRKRRFEAIEATTDIPEDQRAMIRKSLADGKAQIATHPGVAGRIRNCRNEAMVAECAGLQCRIPSGVWARAGATKWGLVMPAVTRVHFH